jgi:hypothetical protein
MVFVFPSRSQSIAVQKLSVQSSFGSLGTGWNTAQECFWYNPAKMPTPAEWVNVRRVRIKDSVEYVWWLSKTPWPKADNRKVLKSYSKDMLRFGNNSATDSYTRQCKEAAIPIHPARFPAALPEFFIKLLTDDGDVVLDPFAGSNTSGAVSVTPPSRFGFAQIAAKYPGTAAVPPHVAHGRRATPMGGPAQRIAEAEPPGSAIPIWQQTGVINDEG